MSEDNPSAAEAEAKVELAADIVSAYVSHNTIGMTEIPALIATVHAALTGLEGGAEPETGPQVPAVSPRTAVKPDSIACLECGKRFKSMKRHLNNSHDLTPNEYRAKWGLRHDYPIVAPAYAEARSALAKQLGLGQKRT
jgi:predicted transcriptional regulator